MRYLLLLLAVVACDSATEPAACEQTALETWPTIVTHADPNQSTIARDTTAMSCTVGETVVQGDLAVGTCVCLD